MQRIHQIMIGKFKQYKEVINRMKVDESQKKQIEAIDNAITKIYNNYILRTVILKDDTKYASILTTERIHEKLQNICFELTQLGSGFIDRKMPEIKHQRVKRSAFKKCIEQSEIKRQNNYHPMRTFKAWMMRLQAKENRKIPPDVLKKVTNYIELHELDPYMCESIREALHANGYSSYNNDAVLIRKMIYKIKPLQFDETEGTKIFTLFGKIIHTLEQIKPDSVTNCPYHPYFAYHIIDNVLPEGDVRRKELPRCIHLQSKETLTRIDRLFKTICQNVPNLVYKPTNRLDYL